MSPVYQKSDGNESKPTPKKSACDRIGHVYNQVMLGGLIANVYQKVGDKQFTLFYCRQCGDVLEIEIPGMVEGGLE